MAKYIKIDKENMVNGPGVRAVLWVSGCNHKCKMCHNPESWNPELGIEITGETIDEIFKELEKDYVQGLSISGGDPFFPGNREAILNIVKSCKKYFNKDIWIWTGYRYEEICDSDILNYVDVIIDGEFSIDQRTLDLEKPNNSYILRYRGSSNQRVIDVKKTKAENKIIEIE